MKVQQALKILAALLLITSAMFPVVTRSYYAGADQVVERDFIFQILHQSDGGIWYAAFIFGWPVLTITALWRKPTGKVAVAARVSEVLLVTYTGGIVWAFIVISNIPFGGISIPPSTPVTGAYLAYIALTAYAVGAIWSDISVTLRWWVKRTI